MVSQARNFFLIILIASFLVRITRLDFPLSYIFFWGDGTRDFLVANHILKYHEFPLVGPFNLLNEAGIYNSPIYFYVLSLFLIPFNNILTLSLVNILLQLGVIVLIYLIAKKVFDYPTAIIAVLLFSFNPEVIKQADFVWQPLLMLPFALLALYLKLKSRDFISLVILSFAVALHNSAICWIPLFFLSQKKSKQYYFRAFTVIFFSFLTFYSPLIIFYLINGFPSLSFNTSTFANSLGVYFSNLTLNIQELLRTFYLSNIMILFLVGGFFIALKKGLGKSRSLIFILLLFISPIIFASFLNKIRLHYLILSLGLLPILVGYITGIFKPFLKILVVLLLIVVFSGNFAYFKEAKNPLDNQKKIDKITSSVVDELNKVKEANRFSDFDFFQVTSFSDSEVIIPYPVLDTFLLVPLEKRLGRKLVQISDTNPYNHFQINKKEYLLVSCFKFIKDGHNCSDYFKSNFQDYNILKMIYNDLPISIYLAKHEQT